MANLQEDEWHSWLSNYSSQNCYHNNKNEKNVLTHAHMLTPGMCTAGVEKKIISICVRVCVCVCVCPSTATMAAKHGVCCTTDVHILRFLAFQQQFFYCGSSLWALWMRLHRWFACNLWSLWLSAVAITWKSRENNPVFLDFRAYTRKDLYTVNSPDPSTFDMAIFMAVRAWPVWKLQANSLCVWQVADNGRSDLPEKCEKTLWTKVHPSTLIDKNRRWTLVEQRYVCQKLPSGSEREKPGCQRKAVSSQIVAPNLPCLTGAFSKSARSTPIARSRHIFAPVRIDCKKDMEK